VAYFYSGSAVQRPASSILRCPPTYQPPIHTAASNCVWSPVSRPSSTDWALGVPQQINCKKRCSVVQTCSTFHS